jgi:hypothetical protein
MLCLMSVIGYIAALGYAWMKFGLDPLLCTNYILSGISAMAMIAVYYKYKLWNLKKTKHLLLSTT